MINIINTSLPHYTSRLKSLNKSPQLPAAPYGIENPVMVNGEKVMRKVEFFFRCLLNNIYDTFETKETKKLYEEFLKVDEKSETFIDRIITVGRKFGCKKEIEINLESGLIEKIAKDGKSHIFIMNHDSQSSDSELLAFFNTLLCNEYKKLGIAKTCPRPKIIMNEDILLSMNPEKRKVFEKIGAVGVDADLFSNNNAKNTRSMLPLLRGFLKDNVNIFIFPEGKLAGKNVPINQKFQQGVSDMITKLSGKKDEINVVPLAFAYNKGLKRYLASIHIGEPIVFKKSAQGLNCSKGNVESEFASEHYKDFFLKNGGGDKLITDNGIPVKEKELPAYISGILCENLEICKKEAKKVLPAKSLEDKIIII